MKKHIIKSFKIKKIYLLIVLCFVVAISISFFYPTVVASGTPKERYLVVIDAGHGGKDGGSIGKAYGTIEKEINLKYAKCLKNLMEQYDFKVVMTRETDSGLYSEFAPNKKRDDMKKRKAIIEKANADFVISIHMNSFPDTRARGAETYFCEGNQNGERLANCIQGFFHSNLPNAKSVSKAGEFFLVEQIDCPSVLVECGFLSNAEEEKLLNTEEYRDEVCYNILLGVLKYLS